MSDDNKQDMAEPSPASDGYARLGPLNYKRMSLGDFAAAIDSQIRTLPVRETSRPTLTNEERETLAKARDIMERLGGER